MITKWVWIQARAKFGLVWWFKYGNIVMQLLTKRGGMDMQSLIYLALFGWSGNGSIGAQLRDCWQREGGMEAHAKWIISSTLTVNQGEREKKTRKTDFEQLELFAFVSTYKTQNRRKACSRWMIGGPNNTQETYLWITFCLFYLLPCLLKRIF